MQLTTRVSVTDHYQPQFGVTLGGDGECPHQPLSGFLSYKAADESDADIVIFKSEISADNLPCWAGRTIDRRRNYEKPPFGDAQGDALASFLVRHHDDTVRDPTQYLLYPPVDAPLAPL